jgi:hypothetical protein
LLSRVATPSEHCSQSCQTTPHHYTLTVPTLLKRITSTPHTHRSTRVIHIIHTCHVRRERERPKLAWRASISAPSQHLIMHNDMAVAFVSLTSTRASCHPHAFASSISFKQRNTLVMSHIESCTACHMHFPQTSYLDNKRR